MALFFDSLKKSRMSLFSSLLAVFWLALMPLAQAVPMGSAEDGEQQYLIICTAQGFVKIKAPDAGENPANNNTDAADSCVVCFSLSALAKIITPTDTQYFGFPKTRYLHLISANQSVDALPACFLPQTRAPPVHIHI